MQEITKVVPLEKNLWAIDEIGRSVMYCLNGRNKALLIDTGFGLSPLPDIVREICGEKEVIVVNTHAHPDHNGGNHMFDRVYTGRFDEPYSHEYKEEDRIMMIQGLMGHIIAEGFDSDTWHPGSADNIGILEDGNMIDLGGYCLEVIETPGHSLGSVCFMENSMGWLFSGDMVLPWPAWGHLASSTVLSIYYKSMVRLQNLQDKIKCVFAAHSMPEFALDGWGMYRLPPEILTIYRDGLLEVLEGKNSGVPFENIMGNGIKAHFRIGGIVYDPKRLGNDKLT